MSKLKLKRNNNNTYRIMFICITLIIISSIFLIIKMGKKINSSIIKISESESRIITKAIINKSISDNILKNYDIESLFVIQKDNNGKIQTIDLDSKKVNSFLVTVNSIVNNNLKDLEDGKSVILDSKNNLIFNSRIISNKKGIIFSISNRVSSNTSTI